MWVVNQRIEELNQQIDYSKEISKEEAEKILNNPQPNENPEELNKLQESINRIKTLMFS